MGSTEAQRLEALRSTDRIGLYSSDAAAHGTDRSGTVEVTIDPTNRLVGVSIRPLDDDQRLPTALAALVEDAFRAALLSKIPDPPPRVQGRPPRAVMFPRPAEQTLDNILVSGRALVPAPLEQPAFRSGHAVGESANRCVTVTLPAGQSRGRLDIDTGWLRNATEANIGAAISQAYAAAYDERDGS